MAIEQEGTPGEVAGLLPVLRASYQTEMNARRSAGLDATHDEGLL
jgi:hypothetical protein